MSKMGCTCGHVIIDQTDALPYKASLLRDEAEDGFWNDVHHALKPLMDAVQSGDKKAIATVYNELACWSDATGELEGRISSIHAHRMSTVYECTNCGRLWVQQEGSGSFVSYTPEDGDYRAVLSVEKKPG